MSDREGEDEEDEMEEKEYKEKDLDKKVFYHFKIKRQPSSKQRSDSSLQLTCNLLDVRCVGVYPKENFIFTNEGVYLDESFYHWTYFSQLDEQFQKKPPKLASWIYDWKGLTTRCWCGERLYLLKISSDFENQDLNSKNLIWDVMPSEVQLEEAMEVTNEHDRQLYFHCGRKSRDE
ncbi:hypothetical protein C1646_774957 [Rhizophagus diaphanus]|nr:hypothetical protein C1646_774957 [Rhizophagus diaphanus] [Rhizophagus sp. MUCL 43196]